MPSRGSLYAVAFTTLLSLVCALLLTGVKVALAERQARNRRLDMIRNVLAVLRIDVPPRASAKDIEALYKSQVRRVKKDGVTVYVAQGPSGPRAYAFPVEGMGLWDRIKGLLAVKPDLKTILGVRFYEQQETPGLGGRISEPDFTRRFEGKSLLAPDGRPGVRLTAPGAAKARNEIDGITGATLTCDGVERFLNQDIQAFLKAMKASSTP